VPSTSVDERNATMAAKIVCISRTDAAFGEQVGVLVAERLGFQYVDEEVIARAARLAQVDPGVVAAVEKRQSFLQGLLDKIGAAGAFVEPTALTVGVPWFALSPELNTLSASPEDLRALIQLAIQQIAKDGSVVIVAHAASMTLASRSDVLRVLITASRETRVRRLAAARGIPEAEAVAEIANGDRNRRDYFRRFHKVDEELPTHYDLVVNTDVLTPEQAVDLAVRAALAGA